jgi:O-antigen chain-terminating methyltransferase
MNAHDMSTVESQYYAFMGFDSAHTRDVLSFYAPMFAGCGPVLELACGRGEFLDLLRESGVEAFGVDLDEGMVKTARERDIDVRLGDALDELDEAKPGSYGGVFSAHFVEHLQPDVLEHVVAESARVLAPGGVFVAATPNAGCLSVLGYDFWRDPTHIRFYEPRLLAFYCAKAGLEVLETGGNPRNAPGPPPESLAPSVHVDPDLRDDMVEAIKKAMADKKHSLDWQAFGHFLGIVEDRLRATQEELVALRRSYAHLLERLYPSNEVYVVARAV